MENILFTFNTVLPVFIIIFLGKILRLINFINDDFINKSSDFVFYVAFPALIFNEVSNANFKELASIGEITMTVSHLIITFFVFFIIGLIFFKDKTKVGVFAQTMFRGNYGIIGLALLYNMYGQNGVARGAIIMSFATVCYNVLSTIGFIVPQQKLSFTSVKKVIFKIFTNPIIISVLISFLMVFIKSLLPPFEYPKPLNTIIKNLAGVSFPLALIGIGGSINFANIRKNKAFIITTTLLRIILIPIVFTIIAIALGFRKESLAALFFLFSVPTAVAGFVLAKTLDGDADSAANLIATTTVGSIFTLSAGIFILKYFQLLWG